MTLRSFILSAVLLHLPALFLSADEVVLNSGITVKGRVVERNTQRVVIDSAGRQMQYSANQVANIRLDPVPEFEEGNRFLAEGNLSAAISAFEKVVRGERTLFQEDARAKLVYCYFQTNRPDDAVDTFLEILKRNPDSQHKTSFPFQYALSLSDPSKVLQRIAGARANVPMASVLEAWTLLASGRREEAEKGISRLLRSKDPDQKELGLVLQLRLLFEAKKYDDCLKLAAEKMPQIRDLSRAWIYYWRGRCFFAKGDYLHAALQLLRAGLLYPRNEPLAGDCFCLAGQCFEKMGRNDRAKKEYTETVTRFPIAIAADLARKRLAAIK